MTTRGTEVVIVGGGLAGSAAAIQLAQAGCTVTLLEASTEAHHKVCGEFLSAEALSYLSLLGVDVGALGAVPIRSVRLASVTRTLPFAAMSVTRSRLDEELLHVAAESGATVLRGQRVQALAAGSDGWTASVEGAAGVTGGAAFLATGKHDLRGYPRPQGKQGGLVGFKKYFRLTTEQRETLRGRVELLLYRGGYAGLQPVEDGVANLCCLIDRGVLQQLGGRWENLLEAMQKECPELRERLAGAQPLQEKALAITSIPYGYVREPQETAAGLWPVGDQAAVIPSFTGDGMSIALHSGCLAAQMYLQGATSMAYQHRLRGELRRQVELATLVSKGLVWPGTRRLFAAAVGVWPGLLGVVARQTRIASPVLLRTET